MKKREPDLRYQKTENLIRKVFYEMIQEMDYGQLTIKELTKRAELNRKTFYLHYPSMDALLGELQIDILKPLLQSTVILRFPRDLQTAARNWFLFSASLGETENKILGSCGNYPVGKNPWEYAATHSGDFFECFSQHPLEKKLITSYWCGSYRDIFAQWVADGMEIPIGQIIDLFCQIMSRGLCHVDLDAVQG